VWWLLDWSTHTTSFFGSRSVELSLTDNDLTGSIPDEFMKLSKIGRPYSNAGSFLVVYPLNASSLICVRSQMDCMH
jgi:hypothetical protein